MAGVSSGIIGGAIAVALLGVLAPVTKKLYYRWNSARYPEYDRTLNAKETAWLSDNARRLSAEKSIQKYPHWTLLLWSGTLPVMLGMGLFAGIIFLIHNALLKPIDPAAYSWLRIDIGPSMVLAVFLGIFVAAIAMIVLAKYSKTLRDYLTYQYGWGYMNPKARGKQEIYEELEHQIRKRHLSSDDEYNSDYFSNLIFERTSPAWKKWTGAVFCLTTVFLFFDTQYAIDVYGDKINVSPYFSLSTHVYSFTDIKDISRECTLGSSDRQEHPYLSYSLQMTDGRKINLFSLEGKGDTPHLDTIEGILPKLENVKFQPTKIDTAPVIKLDPSAVQCVRFIQQVYDINTSRRIVTLFDLSP